MTRPPLVAVFVACLWSAAVVAATGRPGPTQATTPVQGVPASYPPGKGREVVIRVCTDCHAVTDITRRRETRSRWGVIVDAMTSHGAQFTDADFEAMVSYLSVTFGRPIKINTASASTIAEALDISEEHAAAVVTHRTAHGPFKDWKAVAAVPGLDPARVEEQRGNLDFTTGR